MFVALLGRTSGARARLGSNLCFCHSGRNKHIFIARYLYWMRAFIAQRLLTLNQKLFAPTWIIWQAGKKCDWAPGSGNNIYIML